MDSHVILHLSTISGVGPQTIQRLVQRIQELKISFAELYTFSVEQLVVLELAPLKKAELIANGLRDQVRLQNAFRDIARGRADFVTCIDSHYPEMLKNIIGAPAVLFYQGDLSVLSMKTIAFVGARTAHGYSRLMAETLIRPLVAQEWAIVSGGALGADGYAHETAIKYGGRTVAVLGSGLLHWYPREHISLFKSIIDSGGLIVSTFSMNEEARTHNFPLRNRIVSGLSKGCVVLQASKKSGALITAQYALDQGREVFAVPGMVGDDLSVGPHKLIQQGAKLTTQATDIMEEFEVYHTFVQKNLFEEEPINKEKLSTQKEEHGDVLCFITEPTTTDDLLRKTGLSLDELQDRLFQLSLAGILEQDFHGAWRRI